MEEKNTHSCAHDSYSFLPFFMALNCYKFSQNRSSLHRFRHAKISCRRGRARSLGLPGARREARPFSSICFPADPPPAPVFSYCPFCAPLLLKRSAASPFSCSLSVSCSTARRSVRDLLMRMDSRPITLTFVRSLPVRPLPGCGQRWKAGTEKGRTEAVNGGNSAAVVFARSVMS